MKIQEEVGTGLKTAGLLINKRNVIHLSGKAGMHL
jgi:hypothetical protein